MSVLEIIGGILLLLSSIIIIIIVLMQDNKEQGLSTAITGGSAESYFNKNGSRTKEAQLNRLTKVCAIILFVATIVVNVFVAWGSGKAKNENNKNDVVVETSGTVATPDSAE